MPYTPTNWISGQTEVTATRMNNMESGIQQNEYINDANQNLLDQLQAKVNAYESQKNANQQIIDAMQDKVAAMQDTVNAIADLTGV